MMAEPLLVYLDLSQSQQESPSVLASLHRMLQALQSGVDPTPEVRRRVLSAILSSLQASFLLTASPTILTPIATILKLLGRSAAGGEELGREKALGLLVQLGGLERVGRLPPPTSRRASKVLPTHFNVFDYDQDQDHGMPHDDRDGDYLQGESDPLFPYEAEALRCLCNTLMLHPSSRDTFPEYLRADDDRKALRGLLRLLDSDTAGFLSGRILFLVTSKCGPIIRELTENGQTVERMRKFVDRYLRRLGDPELALSLTTGPMPTPADTLREHLKMAYNIMLQYGRLPPPTSPVPIPVPASPAPEQFSPLASPASLASADSSCSAFHSQRDTSDVEDSIAQHADTDKKEARFGTLGATTAASDTKETKKRFRWSGMGGRSPSMTDPSSDEGESSVSPNTSSPHTTFEQASDASVSPSILEERQRSKSPRFFGRKIRDVVTGSSGSSSRTSSPSTSPNVAQSSRGTPLVPKRDGTSASVDNTGALTLETVRPFLPLFQPYLTLSCSLELGDDPKEASPIVRSALNTLLNFPVEMEELDGFEYSWLQPVPAAEALIHVSSYCSRRGVPRLAPLPSRLMELLATTCDAWFPVDQVPTQSTPHSRRASVQSGESQLPAHPDELIPKTSGESAKADEILGPVMLLLRKVSMLAEPAEIMKEILLPDDIDRSIPLERRPDLTGHLIRLLSSLLLPNTAYGVGEFIYNLCDRNPVTLSTQIGYGNASGFLQNRGELIPPPPIQNSNIADRRDSRRASSSTPSSATTLGNGGKGRPSSAWSNLSSTSTVRALANETGAVKVGSPRAVNPITGAFEMPPDLDGEDEMTEEEKEREAEKLYVLFDRMQRTGVMDVENPIRKARGEGHFQDTTEELEGERRRLDEEDERVEREVEREMAIFKSKKKASQSQSGNAAPVPSA